MQKFAQGLINHMLKPLISQKAKLEPQDSSVGASVILHLVDSGSNKDKTFPLGVIENLETLLYVLAKYFDFSLKIGGEVRKSNMCFFTSAAGSKSILMPCPFTYRSQNFLCQTKNLFTCCGSRKLFVPVKNMISIQ